MKQFLTVLLLLCCHVAMGRAHAGDLNPLEMPAVGAHQLRLISPTMLELTLITTKLPDPAPPEQWNFVGEYFALTLPAATEFDVQVAGVKASVAKVGFKRRPLYAPLKRRDLRIANQLYLELATPVVEGQIVTVQNPSGALWAADKVTYSVKADPFRFNPALHVNQHGYMPTLLKTASVGYYVGSLGELPVSAGSFNIIDAVTRQSVYSGTLGLRRDLGYAYNPTPYQRVYEADFTSLKTPGEYMLQVPGMGVSFPFVIGEGVAAGFARTYALGLYHQRCGGSNVAPFTRHEHAACHVNLVEVPDMTFTSVNYQLANVSSDYSANSRHTAPQLKNVDASLYPFVNKGSIDVSLGHHDAGDYSKYTINSAGLIHHLVFAADGLSGVGDLDNLGLPESGDGKSDLLQEAKWEADFLRKMQDADGGFYFLVYPRNRAYEDNVLPESGDPQVVFPKTTAATAAAVGALAEIASSPRFKQQFPAEAAEYMAAATKGWSFLTNAINTHGKDGSYQKITHYGNEFMHDDELAWAAAAMFAATGSKLYHQQLKSWYAPEDPATRRWSWWRLFEGYGCAARTYAFAARSGRLLPGQLDPVYLAACEREIIATGEDIARFGQETAYGSSFPTPNKSYATAGWYFSLERAFELAVAQQIAPRQAYINGLVENMNYEAGNNPVNVTFITGLGWKRWRDIVHQYSQNDHRVLPPSGIPLGNIHAGFAYLENYKQELGKLCYPPDGASSAPYPFYDRWGDSFNTTTEFVVVDQARSLASAAYLMAQSAYVNIPSQNPAAQVLGLPLSIPADQEVTTTLAVPNMDVAQARIVWEARDQEPFIGPAFTFSPKNPGEQWLEVEATWPDGTRAVNRSVFTATTSDSQSANIHQSAPVTPAPGVAALYHLDGDTADAIGGSPALVLAGNAERDSSNLGWMASRAGSALRFYDLGDKATVSIPASILARGTTNTIILEALVYVNAYKAYDRYAVPMLSLTAEWNANLKWMEDTYTGPHIRGGNQFDFYGAALASAVPLQQWRHLSIRLSKTEYSLYVDGKLISTVSGTELPNWRNRNGALELGNFDGWIDEVVVRTQAPASAPSDEPPNKLPVVAIISPVSGATLDAPGSVTIEATATDSDGAIAKVEFFVDGKNIGNDATSPYTFSVPSLTTGVHKLQAIATDDDGAVTASSDVSVTVAEIANQAPMVLLTGPTAGSEYFAPATILLQATAADADGLLTKVEFFVNGDKVGEDATSPYTFTLTNLAAGSHTLQAISTDDDNAVSAPSAVTILVIAPANEPPVVTLTRPVHGSTVDAGTTVQLEATASDSDGSVVLVGYFLNGSELAAARTAPYSVNCANLPIGQHTFTAIAYDNEGAFSSASEVTITVRAVNKPPTVSIIRPVTGSVFNDPGFVTFQSDAADTDGSVVKVEYYHGSLKVAEATTAPYTASVSGLALGSYTFHAVAIDDSGARTTSAAISCSVIESAPVAPAAAQATALSTTQIKLNWTDSSSNEEGFRIYRSLDDVNFTEVTEVGANVTSWTDSSCSEGVTYYYGVVAFNTAGESSATIASATTLAIKAATPTGLQARVQGSSVSLTWKAAPGATSYKVKRGVKTSGPFTEIGNVKGASFSDTTVEPASAYYYTVSAVNSGGESSNSKVVGVRTPARFSSSATIEYTGLNTTRHGDWKGDIGMEGYSLAAVGHKLPSYATVSVNTPLHWMWQFMATDDAALQRPGDNSRIAACWYDASSFEVDITISDTKAHSVSFYLLDGDANNRSQIIEVFDGGTGQLLHAVDVTDFVGGKYVQYNIKGRVAVRFTNISGPNAVLSGIFFDRATK